MSKSDDKFRGFDYVTKVHLELQDLVSPPPTKKTLKLLITVLILINCRITVTKSVKNQNSFLCINI